MSSLKPLKIDIVSDVVCPWCYIGKRRIENALALVPDVPVEVHVPSMPEDQDALEAWLSARAGRKVRMVLPQRGEKRNLVELASRNAALAYQTRAGAPVAGPIAAVNLEDDYRYDFACAAAKASCGQGRDAATIDSHERRRWRLQAMEWLRA